MIKDETASAMTREDVLRELELLPVWHLRSGLPTTVPVAPEALSSATLPANPSDSPAAPVLPVPEAVLAWTQVSSEDGACLFILAQAKLTEHEAQLLQNMAKAMRLAVQAPQAIDHPLTALQASQAKIAIAFGEAAAQQLLASNASLPTLRGQLHPCHGLTLVATHDLAHLLAQPLDKAQAWHDLRLAMQALAALPSNPNN